MVLSSLTLGGVNPYQLGGLWKDISDPPPGIILEVALRAALKACGEEGVMREKELVQSVQSVTPARKRKGVTGKDWE